MRGTNPYYNKNQEHYGLNRGIPTQNFSILPSNGGE